VKPGWIFFDVYANGHEFLVDEGCELWISIRFGFQPSACPSGWSSAEVNQHGLVLSLRLAERSVYVFVPRNCHHYLLKTAVIATADWMLWWIFRSLFYFSCKLLENRGFSGSLFQFSVVARGDDQGQSLARLTVPNPIQYAGCACNERCSRCRVAIHSAYICRKDHGFFPQQSYVNHLIGKGKCANCPILQIVYYKPG